MLDFLLKLLFVMIMFIILFSVTNNISPADVIRRIIETYKEFWVYITSFWGNDDPTNPYL